MCLEGRIGVHSDGKRIINICKALNHENKLRIIDLIFRKGRKSITDVRNELDLSFSTAHKYLDQLEKANMLYSMEVFENKRQKKIYRLNPFVVFLTPNIISSIVRDNRITNCEDRLK